MARTIWFSTWNFRFSVVNGKYPKCRPPKYPLYADSIFNYTYSTYTDKNKRRISDKCCQISTQFGDQLKLWRLFQGINDDLRSGYMKHSTLQSNSRSVSSGYRMKHCVSHLTYYWLCNQDLNETNTSSQSTLTTDLYVYKQLFFVFGLFLDFGTLFLTTNRLFTFT